MKTPMFTAACKIISFHISPSPPSPPPPPPPPLCLPLLLTQLWDSETGYIYSMTDHALAEKFAGAASAKNCSWFTDNAAIAYWKDREALAEDSSL